ncbi:MAG: hypothetical protein N2C14_31285 [Planctomycetales bacterium]
MSLSNRWAVGASWTLAGVWLALLWIEPHSMFWLCPDDSFYYFEIARNLAEGHGSTFDRIEQTNGYHPLWVAVCAPVFALGLDGFRAAQVLITFQWILWCGVLYLLADVARSGVGTFPAACDPSKPSPDPIKNNNANKKDDANEQGELNKKDDNKKDGANEQDEPKSRTLSEEDAATARRRLTFGLAAILALTTAGPMVIKMFVNGMESGVYVPFYALLLWQAQRMKGDFLENSTLAARLGLCALCVMCFLARTDAGLLLLCFGVWNLPAARRLGGWRGFLRLAQVFLVPFLTVVAFLAINKAMFGTSMQVSGSLKRLPLGAWQVGATLGAFAVLAVVVWLFRGDMGEKFPRVKRFLLQTGWFGLFVLALVAYYVGFQRFPRTWHFGPAACYGLMLLLLAYADLLEGIMNETKPDDSPVAPLLVVNGVVAVALSVALLAQAGIAWNSGLISMRRANLAASRWIDKNLPPDVVVGCWDTGVMGYFARQKVINLDGFANSLDFVKAIQTNQTDEFLRKRKLAYFVNHDGVPGDTLRLQATQRVGKDRVARAVLLKEWPFDYAGSTNREWFGTKKMAVYLYELPKDDPQESP